MNIVKLQNIKSTHRNPLHSDTLNNERREREIKETIPFTIATKRIRYLGIYLPKETNGEGNGTPLQYFCLGNSMDGEAWWPAIHGVTKSRTQLSN